MVLLLLRLLALAQKLTKYITVTKAIITTEETNKAILITLTNNHQKRNTSITMNSMTRIITNYITTQETAKYDGNCA